MAIWLVSSFQFLCFFLHLSILYVAFYYLPYIPTCFTRFCVCRFCYRTYPLANLVFIFRRFFVFSCSTYFFSVFLSLSLSHAGRRILVLYFLLSLLPAPTYSRSKSLDLFSFISFFLSSPDILSRIFHDYPFLDPFFLFYFSFASFRIFRIRFSACTLYVSLLFTHRSLSPPPHPSVRFIPLLSTILPRQPPFLIPLSASPSSIYFDRS